ncbi:NAD-dependent protein deacylase [Treponema phagedenis]|uniref:NAD-dependent protein deacetylase n=1 Tax=Treponema phagedenis TaxID=162 RepID=A0A0B7H155_TREPH|nr:NAD-dependent protein deacylase [Treponema phagedenis]EFW39334.1 transcriptional regulator, Sir2 family [Treponema phagedenis F0421]NVP23190.1 NAD-dependent protein deacylase [Treponema phagedenis]QEJ94817.1 NAD-dependent protein deacylase [Treponema phagedenis]QEJ98003.1 NAD-dependent protein deacylase [Treponema phagedenis]QEK00722.1 NAD-dependent protein deacylase [Treponema phagedenis]
MENLQEKYDELYDLIKNAKHCVAFTGAGVSTLSGIKDFRGKDGLYKQPNTEKMFDIDVFYRDPSIYYGLAKEFIYGLEEKHPAIVHIVLAELEKKGLLKALITQNIDLLHQKAGSTDVIEVHGTPAQHYCIDCRHTVDFAAVVETAKTGNVPRCPKCGGVMKPAITFFGEALPQTALLRAERECSKADLLLVLGTSLTVYPAAALPGIVHQNGGKVVIINNQPTYFDSKAVLTISDLGECFEELHKKLN